MFRDEGAQPASYFYDVVASVAALICGSLVGSYARSRLHRAWYGTWRGTVDWLFGHGYDGLGKLWSLLAGQMPGWSVAVALGTVVGLLAPRRWLWFGVLVAIGLVATPQVALLWLGMHPFQNYNASTAVYVLALDISEMPVLLLTAWGVSRWRRNTTRRDAAEGAGMI